MLYLFFSNIGLAPTSNSFITGAAWTISVEFTFYMVFPFLARFVHIEGWTYLLRLIGLMALVKLAAYGVAERPTHMFYSTLVGRFDQFLWGMLAAVLWAHQADWLKRHGRLVLAFALGLGGVELFFYLWHGMLLFTVHHYLGTRVLFDSVALNAIAHFGVLLPLALGLAALSCYTIERPFLALRGVYTTRLAPT